jgi:phosphoesterase RecJ-like protein
MVSYDEIGAVLKGAQRIGVAAHVRPDGDAVGSVLGLALSLREMGKTVFAILEDKVPGNLDFVPEITFIRQSDGVPLDLDVAVALDTATQERLGDNTCSSFRNAGTLINIDHHGSNPRYGDMPHVEPMASSTGQMVYELLKQQGMPITDAIRQNLYVAISTDTGSFQYPATNPATHEIIAEMMAAGLDTARLCVALYQRYPARRLGLMRAMLNEMTFRADDRIVSWNLTRETMSRCEMQPGDTEGLIDTLRMVDTVIAAVIFEDMPDGKIRASARSKDARVNVSEVCAKFGGGGHRAAAGARMKGPIDEAAERFLKELENEVRRID